MIQRCTISGKEKQINKRNAKGDVDKTWKKCREVHIFQVKESKK